MPQGWTLIPEKRPSVAGWSLIGPEDPGPVGPVGWTPTGDMSPPATGPGAAPAPGGPGSIDIPGSQPNWRELIAGDPGYQQLQADSAAGRVADQASRDAAWQRGIAQFGEAPDLNLLSGMVGGDINSRLGNSLELARQNTEAGLSTVARLRTQNQDAVRSITNALNSRGLLRSGETGFQQGKEGQRYTQVQYDARQNLLDYLMNVQSQFTNAERARQQALATGISTAQSNQIAIYGGSETKGVTATLGADGLYHAPDGRVFNPDKTPYTGPAAPQAPPPPAPPTVYGNFSTPTPPSAPSAPRVGGVASPDWG